MEKAGCFFQAHHWDVPAQSWMQAMPWDTGSWGALVKALGGEQVLEGSMREYQLQMYLLSGSHLGEGREWAKHEDLSNEGGRMDAAQKWSSGAHLSQVRAKGYF